MVKAANKDQPKSARIEATTLPKIPTQRGASSIPVTARTHRDSRYSSQKLSSGFLSSRVNTGANRGLHELVDRTLDQFASGTEAYKRCSQYLLFSTKTHVDSINTINLIDSLQSKVQQLKESELVAALRLVGAAADSAIEDVRRILATVRKQYDEAHAEAERKERELNLLRERIQAVDNVSQVDTEDVFKMEGARKKLEDQLQEVNDKIEEAKMNRKVYDHMLERIKREYLHIREQMLKMEKHLKRKKAEYKEKAEKARRVALERETASKEYEAALAELEEERTAREGALEDMMGSLQSMKDSIKRRADFERWRHEVALEAANEAFNASAGRLRKLWVMEKLTGNCLQKIMVEQVQKSQATEDGFQRIREVTGLNDVMDIVHRFLNRELEQVATPKEVDDHLKQCVQEAEARLEELKKENNRLRDEAADANLFVPDELGDELPDLLTNENRSLYIEIDERERELSKVSKSYTISRDRLQKARMEAEHVRRWAERVNKSMAAFEDQMDLSSPQCYQTLAQYFERLPKTIELFCAHVKEQIASGNVQIKSATQAKSRVVREQNELLNDEEFGRVNCRVRSSRALASPVNKARPENATKKGDMMDDVNDEDDTVDDPRYTSDREVLKATSSSKVTEAEKKIKSTKLRKKKKAPEVDLDEWSVS